MAFSSGTYTLPGAALSTGDTVSATDHNQVRNDMATAFNLTWLRNGTAAATANIPMGGFKLTGLAAATATNDALSQGNAASITDLTTSGTVTHSGGTANGVAYLNGSKVLTTGSALVFDGTNLGVGVTPSAWGSNFKAVELAGGALWTDNSVVGANINLFKNAYTDTNSYTYKYKASYAAFGYTQDAGGHKWLTAPSGTAGNAITFTQAMTLDASGNLGVGTTSPSTKFHAYGAGAANRFRSQSSDASGVTIEMLADGSSAGALNVNSNHPLTFATNSAERARIDSSGNFQVSNLAGSGSRTVTASSTGILSASSDSSLKQEVVDAPIAGLAEILQIEPKAYKWLDDIEKRGDEASVELGFFADSVASIIPSAAPMGMDGKYGFYDRAMIAALVKSVHELNAKFESYVATHS